MTRPGTSLILGDRPLGRIGLGTNRLTDTGEHHDFLRAAVDAGLRFIDTAHLYSGGESEASIGSALAPFPDDLVVATKGGYKGGGSDRLRRELEASLERLRTDSIDLYYLHRVDPEVPIEETMAVLGEYREAGRIRNVGLSEVSVDEIERARSVVPIAAVQNEYSLGERKHEDVIDHCEAEGIVFVPFFPLRGGSSGLAEVAERHGASENQIRVAWLLARSPVVAPIPGTLSLGHLRENLAAAEIELSAADVEALGT